MADTTMDLPKAEDPAADALQSGAEVLLCALKAAGIERLYVNAGTDFTPMVEALARLDPARVPEPVIVTHETAAVAMAHGDWLATGRMAAVMVHVNVGLANSAMGLINAAADNVPILMMSGRTPLTESGRLGSRRSAVQYGQEMFDQSALVAEATKFRYELRYPEQAADLVQRAVSVALSAPRGPVYLSLPREPLSAPPERPLRLRPAVPAAPTTAAAPALDEAAEILRGAKAPLIVAQRADRASGQAVAAFAEALSIPVAEPFTVSNVLPTAHPMALGARMAGALAQADVLLALDCPVPWLPDMQGDQEGKRVLHIGPDPLFRRIPVRGHAAELALAGELPQVLPALAAAVSDRPWQGWAAETVARAQAQRRTMVERALADTVAPMTPDRLSLELSRIVGPGTLVFNELGLSTEFVDLPDSAQMFTIPHSGGLGWGVPAAMGAQLADRDRLVVACVGDGSFIFANPVACLQAIEALSLPLLIVIENNAAWDAVRLATLDSYPDGAAARANRMPLVGLDPSPDFATVAAASRVWGRRVETAGDLPAALDAALEVVRVGRRAALLDVATRLKPV